MQLDDEYGPPFTGFGSPPRQTLAVHEPANAATIRGVAVNELLLAQRHKVVCDQGLRTFLISCTGDRPSRATLSLILHGGHHTLCRPVRRSGQGFTIMPSACQARHSTPQIRTMRLVYTTVHNRNSRLMRTANSFGRKWNVRF